MFTVKCQFQFQAYLKMQTDEVNHSVIGLGSSCSSTEVNQPLSHPGTEWLDEHIHQFLDPLSTFYGVVAANYIENKSRFRFQFRFVF